MKKILLAIVFLCAGAVGLFQWFFNQPCAEWERPGSVPEAAVWKGGCDGGNWIELVSMGKDSARFKIYRDWNGDLILDRTFKYQNCNSFRLTRSNWTEHIAYFEEGLEFYNRSGEGKCRLVPGFPTYYKEQE